MSLSQQRLDLRRRTTTMKPEDKTENPHKPDPPKGPPDKTVTIKVDGVDREVPKDKMTAAELKALLGIDPSQVLDEVDEDGTFKPLAVTSVRAIRSTICRRDWSFRGLPSEFPDWPFAKRVANGGLP